MCNAKPACTWTFDGSRIRCKETKEIESNKMFWMSQGATGSVPPSMRPGRSSGGSVGGFGPSYPQPRPQPVGVDMAGVSPQPRRPVGMDMAGIPPQPNVEIPPRPRPHPQPVRPRPRPQPVGVEMAGVSPQPRRPVGMDMAGIPPQPNARMPIGFPVDCEMIQDPKQCYAQPMCSYVMDDSMWVCMEMKEVETNKHFWAVTNAHQGRMPGPIPGTHGFGGMPPSNRGPPQRTPPFAERTNNAEPSAEESSGATYEQPGYKKLQKALKHASLNIAIVDSEPKTWLFAILALASFLLGFSLVTLTKKYSSSMWDLRTTLRKKKAVDEFVRLGDKRQI